MPKSRKNIVKTSVNAFTKYALLYKPTPTFSVKNFISCSMLSRNLQPRTCIRRLNNSLSYSGVVRSPERVRAHLGCVRRASAAALQLACAFARFTAQNPARSVHVPLHVAWPVCVAVYSLHSQILHTSM